MEGEELLTITQAATELGCSRRFVYTLIQRGDLKPETYPYKRRATMKIPRSQIDALKPRPSAS